MRRFALRIIPALAGNTSSHSSGSSARADHPRSRGEYWPRALLTLPGQGSSPLSRGIPFRFKLPGGKKGIIPALAGNTEDHIHFFFEDKDHPRSRGEYAHVPPRGAVMWGSSPLSRGIHLRAGNSLFIPRIIPALAGNTTLALARMSLPRDHPRSRGEYEVLTVGHGWGKGSSPLSRGILTVATAATRDSRIIPALAGNTRIPPCPSYNSSDHPRSRGEYPPGPGFVTQSLGSSPLSRGIHSIPS